MQYYKKEFNIMNDIYIIGAGGFAKEVCFLIKSSTNFEVKGFIDKCSGEIEFNNYTIPIIDEDYFLSNFKNVNVCIGIGNPMIISKLYNKYKDYKFPNIIHSSVIYDYDNIKIGSGNIITAGCKLTTFINIGSLNIFNLNTTVGHDVSIGNCNVFNPLNCSLLNNCTCGGYVVNEFNCNVFNVFN